MNIAKTIDHTLLKPEATAADIQALCREAKQYGFASVCVNTCYVEYMDEKESIQHFGAETGIYRKYAESSAEYAISLNLTAVSYTHLGSPVLRLFALSSHSANCASGSSSNGILPPLISLTICLASKYASSVTLSSISLISRDVYKRQHTEILRRTVQSSMTECF